ncbi:MAG: MBL fold metallo-hydrolase [Oscillospiraceae bacterium]|nr:MBL fold metallo-hydrolase [Oscillospiraceae bacterium]MBR6208494.1 MBL fold metallo-hydrolase [Oscillospiraceae bacterium]
MHIKALEVGYFQTNCYVAFDEETLDTAVIDPGADSNKILNFLEEHHCKVRAILLTHAHFDHCMGLEEVYEATHAPVYMSHRDLEADIGNLYFGIDWALDPPEDTHFVSEGDVIEAGVLRFEVLETPGHTPGGLSFICQNALFTGDTLFRRSIGRYDLPASDALELGHSLEKLRDLPGDYEVFPGHESATELDYERRFNHYMNAPWEL